MLHLLPVFAIHFRLFFRYSPTGFASATRPLSHSHRFPKLWFLFLTKSMLNIDNSIHNEPLPQKPRQAGRISEPAAATPLAPQIRPRTAQKVPIVADQNARRGQIQTHPPTHELQVVQLKTKLANNLAVSGRGGRTADSALTRPSPQIHRPPLWGKDIRQRGQTCRRGPPGVESFDRLGQPIWAAHSYVYG